MENFPILLKVTYRIIVLKEQIELGTKSTVKQEGGVSKQTALS